VSFQQYKRYKESGVDWLGAVPDHWHIKAIKWISAVLRGASPRPIDDPKYFDDEGEYAWVRIADVSAANGILQETPQRLSCLGSSLSVKLEPGSLFVSVAGSVGKPCITAIKACIHDGFVYFPRLSGDPKFLYRIFEAGQCYGGLGKLGTQLNLNTDTIGSFRIPIPPDDEISAILTFLDRETTKIDALVVEQKRLIELLSEKRQAVITETITRGLNPHVQMKVSGIGWLGEVPGHWTLRRLKQISPFVTVGIVVNPSDYVSDEGLPFLYGGDITEGRIDVDNCRRISFDDSNKNSKTRLEAGDLVTVRVGAPGVTAVVPSTCEGGNCASTCL
jgi:type I restriction enzyme S subunit